jgi:hypothetical protein
MSARAPSGHLPSRAPRRFDWCPLQVSWKTGSPARGRPVPCASIAWQLKGRKMWSRCRSQRYYLSHHPSWATLCLQSRRGTLPWSATAGGARSFTDEHILRSLVLSCDKYVAAFLWISSGASDGLERHGRSPLLAKANVVTHQPHLHGSEATVISHDETLTFPARDRPACFRP